jgi:hypothetical protein
MDAFHLSPSLYVVIYVYSVARCGDELSCRWRNRTNRSSSSSSSKAPANAPPASTSEGSSGANVIQKIRISTPAVRLY